MRRASELAAPLFACALGLLAVGCGGGGVSKGATVSVYVSAPMRGAEGGRGREICAGAKQVLAAAGGRAGDVRVRAICLDVGGPQGTWALAQVGANARRATEDSTTVAYIGEPSPKARRQSDPILEAAEIADIPPGSGSSAMRRVLDAIGESSSASLREAVRETLHGS